MTDMQFGLLLTVLGGGLTLISLGLIVASINVLVYLQTKNRESKQEPGGC